MKAAELVEHLQLSKHVEGGYFRRLYEGQKQHEGHHDMTAIYYLLTGDSPVDRWHINKSDIFHSHIRGGSLHYYVIHPDGHLQHSVLGQRIEQGEVLTLVVPGGTWKAVLLEEGQEYGLITEAVTPGFQYEDMKMATN